MPIVQSTRPHISKREIVNLENDFLRINNSITTISNTDSSIIYYSCGETINAGWAVGIKSDGLIYKASILASDNLGAVVIATEYGETGNSIKCKTNGTKVSIADATFTSGSRVFLTTGTVNLTTTLPTITSGNIEQIIGVAVSTTEVMINIEEPIKFE